MGYQLKLEQSVGWVEGFSQPNITKTLCMLGCQTAGSPTS
ncbi:hypothetical protein CRENPOLYSF1_100002 [Crenothrix polyspora]|uniref:Uncharacterized protein n=1 Tax=Crenothrix polyspora TaxID=360316 RepID=A0A1R4GYI4_9GAMM|nr:hypothetical protein CRENPOLYSF1_100002 [Crenothrix polyspora]